MTVTTARTDLYTILEAVNATGLTVYNHVPSVNQSGVIASIDWAGASSTMTDYTLIVRVYVRASLPDVETAQNLIGEMIDAIEEQFDAESVTATWRVEYLPELDVWLTEWAATMPRTDF